MSDLEAENRRLRASLEEESDRRRFAEKRLAASREADNQRLRRETDEALASGGLRGTGLDYKHRSHSNKGEVT